MFKENIPKLVLPLATEGNAVEKEILRATGELGNHILTNGASKNLAKIKAEHPNAFTSLALYTNVLDMLAHYHFRLPVRRFILGLFDIKFEGTQWDRLDGFGESLAESNIKVGTPSGASSNVFTFGKRSASTSAISGTTTPYGMPSGSQHSSEARSAAAVNRRVMTTPLLSHRNSEGGSSQIYQRLDDSPIGMQSSPPVTNDTGLFKGTLAERKLRQPPLPISTSALLSSPGRAGAYQSGVTSPISVDSPITQEQRDIPASVSSPSLKGPDTPEPARETERTMTSVSKALLRLDTSLSAATPGRTESPEPSPELALLSVTGDSPRTPLEALIPSTLAEAYTNGGPLSGGLEQPSPVVALGSPMYTPSLPPPPPPRPPPHAYEILYTNKPYHKNFAKEAGLAPLPPRVKTMLFAAEEDDKEDRKRWPALGGSLHENPVPQVATPPPTNSRHGATKVVIGFNPPPPPPKALPNFANFMNSRPRRQYNAAILAAHSANSTGTTTTTTTSTPASTTSPVTANATATTTGATGMHAPLPDFSHLPQTRRKRPPLAPLLAGRIQAPVAIKSTASRSRSSTLTGILESEPDETPSEKFRKADQQPKNHVALGSPLMQDSAEWSSGGPTRAPSSPLFAKDQALSRSRTGSMTENGYGSHGSTTSSIRHQGMGSPDLRQENGSRSPGFLPPPPPLMPITGTPKPRRLSDVQAASRIGGIISTGGSASTFKNDRVLTALGGGGGSGGSKSAQSSPRLGSVPFPRPPPVLANVESSFQRMSLLANVPPPSQVISPAPALLAHSPSNGSPLPPPAFSRSTTATTTTTTTTTSSSELRAEDSQNDGSDPSSDSTTPAIQKTATIGLGLS